MGVISGAAPKRCIVYGTFAPAGFANVAGAAMTNIGQSSVQSGITCNAKACSSFTSSGTCPGYCTWAGSACELVACSVTDGSGRSSTYPCTCGTSSCHQYFQSSQHCTASANQCAFPACDVTDGSTNSSTYPCECGTTSCHYGQACSSSSNECLCYDNDADAVANAAVNGLTVTGCADMTSFCGFPSGNAAAICQVTCKDFIGLCPGLPTAAPTAAPTTAAPTTAGQTALPTAAPTAPEGIANT